MHDYRSLADEHLLQAIYYEEMARRLVFYEGEEGTDEAEAFMEKSRRIFAGAIELELRIFRDPDPA